MRKIRFNNNRIEGDSYAIHQWISDEIPTLIGTRRGDSWMEFKFQNELTETQRTRLNQIVLNETLPSGYITVKDSLEKQVSDLKSIVQTLTQRITTLESSR